MKKTKILIAHKRETRSCSFSLYNKSIEIVNSFCYLGIEINKHGNFKQAIQRLHSKAHRAYMAVIKNINFYNGSSIKSMVKIYESMIQSVLLYGSELWGIFGWRSNTLSCINNYLTSNNHIFEKLHSKVCKHILGLNRQSPDILAKAELGRFPLMSNIIKQSYTFWQHILQSDHNSILYKALQININLDRKGHDSYYTRIKSLLSAIHAKDKIYPISPKQTIKKISTDVKNKYCKIYEEHFFKTVHSKGQNCQSQSPGKFFMYQKIKRNYIGERYLYNIKQNNLRKHLTALRCASNLFPINYLRKFNVDRKSRFCNLCQSQNIGDEQHILLKCQNAQLQKFRMKFTSIALQSNPQLKVLNDYNFFIYISLCINKDLSFIFAIFLEKIHKLLKQTYKCNKENNSHHG